MTLMFALRLNSGQSINPVNHGFRRSLKLPIPLDLPVRLFKEIAHYLVKLFFFKYRCGMARIGYDPQVRVRDGLCNQHGMFWEDHVVVAAYNQCRAGDAVQLVGGNVRFI